MAGERSQRIYGRIYRVLTKQLGMSVEKYQKEEIFDEMVQAQKAIFATVKFDRKFSLILQEDQGSYPLHGIWITSNYINSQNNAIQPTASKEANTTTGLTAVSGTLVSNTDHRPASEGSYGVQYTVTDSLNEPVYLSPINCAPGYYYYFKIWAKSDSGKSVSFYLCDALGERVSNYLTFGPTSSWAAYDGYFYVTNNSTQLGIETTLGVGDAVNFDDLEIIEAPEGYSGKNIFAGIKSFIVPSTWTYELEKASESLWNDIVNGGEYDSYTNPAKAMIFENELWLYPPPIESGDVLQLLATLKGPETDISSDVDPELDPEWDTAIEDWVLYRLTREPSYLNSYNEFIKNYSTLESSKGNLIQRQRCW